MSRACLGKMVILMYKWRKKWRFFLTCAGLHCSLFGSEGPLRQPCVRNTGEKQPNCRREKRPGQRIETSLLRLSRACLGNMIVSIQKASLSIKIDRVSSHLVPAHNELLHVGRLVRLRETAAVASNVCNHNKTIDAIFRQAFLL